MDVSTRESIMNNIEQTLATITLVNGYNNDIAVVIRATEVMSKFESPDEYPLAIIEWEPEEKEIMDLGAQYVQSDLPIIITGAIYDTGPTKETTLNNFLADIQKVMVADTRRDGFAEYTDPVNITMLKTDKEHIAAFEYRFRIRYFHLNNKP